MRNSLVVQQRFALGIAACGEPQRPIVSLQEDVAPLAPREL